MKARQAVIVEPFKVEVRDADLPDPAPNQILVECEASAISAGTELAVYTGSHQWLKDPKMTDWKFPFRPGYSAAGRVVAVGSGTSTGWKAGDRVSYPGNHATARTAHDRPRARPALEDAGQPVVREGGPGLHLPLRPRRRAAGRHHARPVGRRRWDKGSSASSRCGALLAAGLPPGDRDRLGRRCAATGGAWRPGRTTSSTRRPATRRHNSGYLGARGAEVVIDATGVPDAVPWRWRWPAMPGRWSSWAARGRIAKDVNFYDDLHRRYIEVLGAHGNMLFEPAHTRLAGAWDINKAQKWLLGDWPPAG